MFSKALVAGVQQRKLEELAALPEISHLTVVVPPYWEETRVGRTYLDKKFTRGYELIVDPMWLNGHHHTHFYPRLNKHMKQVKPDLVHADEESFNLATFEGIWLAQRHNAASVFYNWANIYKNYPPPFSFFEKYNFKHAGGALAGNSEASDILRQRGFTKPVEICPQFGVDLEVTHRTATPPGFNKPGVFTIGNFGRLVPEKGLDTLIEACSRLKGDWRLVIIGSGSAKTELEEQVTRLDLQEKVEFLPMVPSTEVAAYMSGLDVFVLPSITYPNWKEQFGRVLIEAMACQVSVIGSSSGEIPHVIGEAGLVFPEKDVEALAAHLQSLLDDSALRSSLSQKGLQRVKENFTQQEIARKHLKLYQEALKG
ncbi:MAG TPA: glycosyltransferase [Chloroflexia bacterium]|nr:glycosyltransferase [Chloroflexia bacterium]